MASRAATTRLNRTHSSPSLSGWPAHHRGNQHNYQNVYDNPAFKSLLDEDDEFYVIGDRVYVDGHKAASVAYFGEVEFAPGDWVGVVMDHPLGNHNGKVHGREYFQCSPFHGLMVRPHRVSRILGADSSRSSSGGGGRASTTPLPTLHQQRPYLAADGSAPSRRSVSHYGPDGGRSPAASSVTTDSSYFYDDDYRPTTRLPSIAALGKRINEIEAGSYSRPQSALGLSSPTTTTPTPSPVGILKKSPSYHQRPTPRARSETRHPERQDSYREPDDPRVPVFNFRPRRAKLDQLQSRIESQSAGSSPSRILSDMSNRTTTADADAAAAAAADLRSSEPPQVGDRVWVNSERGDLSGLLRFVGETNFATGEWAGIELDRPWGKNDGSVLGYRYFYCPQDYGLFVPATRVRKHQLNSSWPGFKAMRSTIKSPPPPKTTGSLYDSGSGTGSRSMTPSSYYSSSAASSGKNTPSTYETRTMADYASSSPPYGGRESSLSSLADDPIVNHFTPRIYDNSYRLETPKFDDNDMEYQIRRSIQQNNYPLSRSQSSTATPATAASQLRPRSIKYTFSRSRYDGNPVARRTVEYD